MKKYYIEIYDKLINELLIESKWFDTKEEALRWFEDSFCYHGYVGARLNSVDFDENGEYNEDEIKEEEKLSW